MLQILLVIGGGSVRQESLWQQALISVINPLEVFYTWLLLLSLG